MDLNLQQTSENVNMKESQHLHPYAFSLGDHHVWGMLEYSDIYKELFGAVSREWWEYISNRVVLPCMLDRITKQVFRHLSSWVHLPLELCTGRLSAGCRVHLQSKLSATI